MTFTISFLFSVGQNVRRKHIKHLNSCPRRACKVIHSMLAFMHPMHMHTACMRALQHICLNKKCGRRIRLTRYAPLLAHCHWHRYSSGPRRRRLITWPCNLDLWDHGACGWCGSSSFTRIQSLKFVALAVRNICSTMCVSINGPGDLDLWPRNWCASPSEVWNLPSKFGIRYMPLGSRIIRCLRDGRIDGQQQRL